MTRKRVLLADMDERLLVSYRDYLSREGFQVATAATGLDCVAKLRSFVPDVLVLDPELPWGRGDGVLAVMHEDADVPVVPVMVLADHYGEDNLYPVGVFPVSAYHLKPLAPSLLAESIRRLLRKRVAAQGRKVAR